MEGGGFAGLVRVSFALFLLSFSSLSPVQTRRKPGIGIGRRIFPRRVDFAPVLANGEAISGSGGGGVVVAVAVAVAVADVVVFSAGVIIGTIAIAALDALGPTIAIGETVAIEMFGR